MRIVQAYRHFPSTGGVETHILSISEAMSKRNHVCYILTPRWIREWSGISSSDYYSSESVLHPEQLLSLPEAVRLLRKLEVDVLHIHGSGLYAFTNALLLIGGLLTTGIVITPSFNPSNAELARIYDGPFWLVKSAYYFAVRPHLLKRADAIIAQTRAEAKLYRFWGLENVYIIPPSVDVKSFQSHDGSAFRRFFSLDNQPIVLGVGRLVPYKGFADLVEAARILVAKYPEVLFVIVGEGPEKDFLKALVEKYKITRSVLFTGYLTSELLREAYSACNVFVLPSYGEPLGIVLIEALAAGKPIIATSSGGVPEVVDERSAILVPQQCINALAASIEEVLTDKSLADSMGQASYERAKELYDSDIILTKVEQVYESVLRQ